MIWVTITLTLLLVLFLLTEPVSATFSNVSNELLIDIEFVFFAVTVYPTRKQNNKKSKKSKPSSSKIYLRALYRMRRRVRISLDELSVGLLPLPPHLAAPFGETVSALLARYTRDDDPSRIRLFAEDAPLRFRLNVHASLYDLLRYLLMTHRMKKKMEKIQYGGQ